MFRCSLLIIGLFISINVYSQEKFSIKADLSTQWQVFENNNYTPVTKNSDIGKSIHFSINSNQHPTDRLLCKSARPFYLFVNGKLFQQLQGTATLSIDSIAANTQTSNLTFTIYQDNINVKELKTFIIREHSHNVEALTKPATYFRDFVVLAGLLVIMFFVIIIRLHPKLAADYFSISRIISLREVEDNQPQARLAISSNVLFYIFSSLLTGLCLLITFQHLPDDHILPLDFRGTSFAAVFLEWMRLSAIILLILFGKILIIFSLSTLFGLKSIAGIHFFNWIRLLLIICGSLSVMLFIYFISRGTNDEVYVVFLTLIVVALVAWTVIVFLKLNNRTEHSMFHLFSYICATEVIPLLITIKVLFQ
jgi:hypothetical protein